MPKKDDARDLIALVEQPYELDPAGLATLTEMTLQLPQDQQERVIFSALVRLRVPVARLNLTRLIQAVVEAQPKMIPILKRSMKRRGRCPAGARLIVRGALGLPQQVSPKGASILTSPAHPHAERSVGGWGELLLNPRTTSFQALPGLFNAIAAVAQGSGRLTVRVKDFVYASELAIVATRANARGAESEVTSEDKYTAAYLRRIGFHEALRGVEQPVAGDQEDWSVRLTIVGPNARVEDVTARILDILDTFVHPSSNVRSSFGILLAELIENVKRHANAKTPGFVVAQVYPRNYKLGITIADPGIRIKRSFLEGEAEEYKDPDKPDSEYIRLALQPLVTSKRSGHAGYGLYILAELIRRHGGTFGVTSGEDTVVGFRVAEKTQESVYSHAPWQGTVVTMIVDLQRQLPLGEVYKSLPFPPGYDATDFFDV